MTEAIELYVMVFAAALPYALAFAVGNLIVRTLLTSAFTGKLIIK